MDRFDNFTAIDLETTGLDPSDCVIIELGAVRYENGVHVESFSQLIRPNSPIPEEITRLTGIDNDMVESVPTIDSIIEHFESFLDKSPWIVGHNIDFDFGFLRRHLGDDKISRLERRSLDTGILSRILFPRLQRYSLGSLIGHFKIDRGKAHRALSDCKATAELYLKLIARLGALPVSSRERVGKVLFGNKDVELFRRSIEPLIAEVRMEETLYGKSDSIPAGEIEQEYPDNIQGEAPPEEYEDYVELSEAAVENHFLPGGLLSKVLDRYEYRSMQAEMAVSIARAFNRSEFLLVEAPTGVGKSIAYLLPAAWWASLNHEKVIISTQTKSLQSQLFYKDIPQILKGVVFKFKAVLLKGRGNYLCLYKYHELLAEAETTFNKNDRNALASVMLWADNTRTGDISECSGFNPNSNYYIWSRISCEGGFCLGQACGFAEDCFLLRVRREASTAQVVVTNHYLTFADFASGGDLVRESGHIIFDEAHNLERIAASYLGGRFDKRALDFILAEMHSSRPTPSGFLINLKFGLSTADDDGEPLQSIDSVIDSIITLGRVSGNFFERLSGEVRNMKAGDDIREIRIYRNDNPCSMDEREELMAAFARLSERLDRLISLLRENGGISKKREITARLESFAGDLMKLKNMAANLLYADDPDYVYWLDVPSSPRFTPSILSAPLEVGKLLDQKFYDYLKTSVFTSATMTVKGSFVFFAERLGLDLGSRGRTLSLCLNSPFDIDSEVAVISTGFLPSPKHPEFENSAFDTLGKLLMVGVRKSMVLFTSYRSLRNAADYLAELLEQSGIDLYFQQGSFNAERVLRRFKSSSKAVLFGTDTFWEGVDLPGELLELLIMFKLPFTVPDRPWFKANLEKIEADGLSSFAKLSLPDAVVKFRQGFGRLIRTAEDRGCVVILDSRVEKASFGSHFTKSVKGTKFRPETSDQAARIIKDWLDM